MDPVQHPHCNSVLRAPPDRPEVVDLHILRGQIELPEGPQHVVQSFWQPTPEELALLNSNGRVLLSVYGQTFAPVAIGVTWAEADPVEARS